jgi:hypothetical protein
VKRIAALPLAAVFVVGCAAGTTATPSRATASAPSVSLPLETTKPPAPIESESASPSASIVPGLPDRAAMEAVVGLVNGSKLPPGPKQLYAAYRADLPAKYAALSEGGSISIHHDKADGLTIIFYKKTAGPDHYAGWVYRSSGMLDGDPNAGGPATVDRIDQSWFWVIAY